MTEIVEFTETKKQHTITLNPKAWSYEEYAKFLNALMAQEWETALPLVMKITVAWSYDVPISPTAYLELPFDTLAEITKSVRDTLTAYIEGLDASSVTVDMTRWTMRDFLDFRKAAKTNDVKALERMMRKVCRLKEKPADRLTFEQGSLMSIAIKNATTGMFAQGN